MPGARTPTGRSRPARIARHLLPEHVPCPKVPPESACRRGRPRGRTIPLSAPSARPRPCRRTPPRAAPHGSGAGPRAA
eukprot:2477945-Pleurochrysis_carterae.AAC.1